ncbi:MAG: hypothetical protein HYY44_03620, partial [Deltaproteobacteria bacterium]|nr:hypothetical protein [Deltaproteobacteria bacterium]
MRKALLIFAILFLSPIVAASPLPRKILALYDSKEFPNLVDTPIHRHAFTTFDAVKNPVPYCRWLEKQIRGGKKVVILEEPGIFKTREMEINRDCFKALHSLGIDTLGFYSDNPYYYEIVEKDPSLVEFERKIDLTEGLPYSLVRAGSPGAKSYLKARRLDMKESLSDLVVTTPHGGFAHPSYVTYGKKELGKLQWRLNPFLFFERALGLEGRPRPDITTLNGVRTFFSHIDGDGLLNVSEIDRKSYSGEIILSEILKKQTSIPITASFITGYLDLPEFKNERVMKLHQEILSLPNIEAGAHGYAHPLIWGREDGKLAIKIPGYRFDHEKEISGSIRMVNHLLAAGQIQKRTKLFQWTGDCLQSQQDLSIANQSEIPNINGGEPRFDRRFDSYAFVAP